MFKELCTLVLLAAIGCVYTENHEWELAVTIDDRIEFLDRDGNLLGISPQRFSQLKGITYDDIKHQFLVSDMIDKFDSIYKIPLKKSATALPVVKDIPDDVKYLAVDRKDHVLYWSDSYQKKIMYMSLTEPNAKAKVFLEFEGDSPQGIAIDSCRRKVYWANANHPSSTIKRANLDGSNVEIIAKGNIFFPSGITIDQSSRRIYWADHGEGIYYRIESAKLDGANRRIVFQDTHGTPVDLAVNDQYIYWTDEDNNMLWALSKESVQLGPKKMRKFSESPKGLLTKYHDYANIPECQFATDETHGDQDITTEYIEEAKDSLQCLNNGELTLKGCECLRGYSGLRCEIDGCYNYCLTGECRINSDGYPVCNCPAAYTKDRCEQAKCINYCLNGGTCNIGGTNLTSPMCDCPTGYSGQRCDQMNYAELCTCEGGVVIIPSDGKKPFCSCNREYGYEYQQHNVTALPISESFKSDSELISRLRDPLVMIFLFATILLLFVIFVLTIALYRVRNRRPRIKKRIIVNKNVTPLTCRPNQPTEQCEITIENCCNMNICETPCFEPEQIRGFQRTKTEDKKTLLNSMENGDDLY